ncbi:PLDc_N domain-containing protein [Planctomycetota bacterium]|nr:PLDc_N domain-containing protein [Planctomycetota bacterium]
MLDISLFIAQAEAIPIFGGLIFFGIISFCGLLSLVSFAFWIWALVDCCSKDFKDNDKIVWILVIVFTYWIGALIYFLIGRQKAIEQN